MMIVEMHRIPKPPDAYDLFDCPGPLWKALRKLGEAFGWQPRGTVVSPRYAGKAAQEEEKLEALRASVPPDWEALAQRLDEEARDKYFLEGKGRMSPLEGPGFQMRWKYSQLDLYEPRTWGKVIRMVTVEDAAAWAQALDRGLLVLERLGLDLPHEGAAVFNTELHPELNDAMNGGLKRPFIQAFSTYLKGGAFGFAWDD